MHKDRKITRENRKKGRQEEAGNPFFNPSHCPDPTAHDAIAKADKRDQRKKGNEKK